MATLYCLKITLQEVMHFLQQLTASMGQNMKFRVRNICEGDDLTVAANWHLGGSYSFPRFTTFLLIIYCFLRYK